jgi:transposase-like protein
VFVSRYSEEELREVVGRSASLSEVLRHFGLRTAGGNFRQLRRWLQAWNISTDHFRLEWEMPPRARKPLSEILVEHSTYGRGHLKRRLYEEGLKDRECELCGQGEMWRGSRMALILDHINGIADDNRLENLRIVCPNCAATFETHCGRQNRLPEVDRTCLHCGGAFIVKHSSQRYCSRLCGTHAPKPGNRLARRRVERPPYEQLVREVEEVGWSAVGRRYGVSDNAVRKWVRGYERARGGASLVGDGVE